MPDSASTAEGRADGNVVLELPDDESAAGRARSAVRTAFNGWGLTELVEDAELAVSELVTNAFKHGLPPVQLRLRQQSRRVRLDVSDTRPATGSVEWPTGVAPVLEESGRGRSIVEAVSDHSGTEGKEGNGTSSYASWDVAPQTRIPE